MRALGPIAAILFFFPVAALAETFEYDEYLGEEINRTCAGCHGPNGQGGGGGGYPRLAGMSAKYISGQLRKFKSRERENIPMLPFSNDRELPEEDLVQIAEFLSRIRLQTFLPVQNPNNLMDGYERLKQAKQVLKIPREPGDTEAGRDLYREDCALCHGKTGYGKKKAPLLAGQYIVYLRVQIQRFLAGERTHEDPDELFRERSPEDWQNLWAYVSILDD